MCRWLLMFSKNRQSIITLDNLYWCSTICTLKCILMFSGNFLHSILCPLAVSTSEKTLSPSSLRTPFKYLYTLMRSHWTSSYSSWPLPALSAFICSTAAPVILSLCGATLNPNGLCSSVYNLFQSHTLLLANYQFPFILTAKEGFSETVTIMSLETNGTEHTNPEIQLT